MTVLLSPRSPVVAHCRGRAVHSLHLLHKPQALTAHQAFLPPSLRAPPVQTGQVAFGSAAPCPLSLGALCVCVRVCICLSLCVSVSTRVCICVCGRVWFYVRVGVHVCVRPVGPAGDVAPVASG